MGDEKNPEKDFEKEKKKKIEKEPEKQTKTVILPMSYTTLAEYLSVDRSAMMRELRHLKEQGIVCTDGRQIRLLGERPTAWICDAGQS